MSLKDIREAIVDGIEVLTITRRDAEKTVVLLHGYGASFRDLFPLADYLDPDKKFNWVFPNGIKEVPLGQHMTGRAWFPIRMAEIEAAAMQGKFVDFTQILPDGMKDAESRLLSLMEKLRLKPSDTMLGGFSQGAMMAVQACANLDAALGGLVLFSGTLINASEWEKKLPAKSDTPVFQSHGKNDPILSYHQAVKLNEFLNRLKFNCPLIDFNGYHEIPLNVIQKARLFIGNFGK